MRRFDLDFDLPRLPAQFPPPVFLPKRPELGDVSHGEVVSISNYFRVFKGPPRPGAVRRPAPLLTPFPQEEFNPTDDRCRPSRASGWPVSIVTSTATQRGHSHLDPDNRPQHRRFRLDTAPLRGLNVQRLSAPAAQAASKISRSSSSARPISTAMR